ncbi:MAG: MBL fold metallo-hydrolase [Anaerolineales bacterium]|nr:MBL fold metallo-hydrolase [Anaerolineales bacterium]
MPVKNNQLRHPILTLDLNFMGINRTIAAYLIPHSNGGILIECGPGSTIGALQEGLKQHGFTTDDITDVFLTHIHLDHAGAAGWLARKGAMIHVHPVGAPHLLYPEKLLASAGRIYGELMDTLWGEFLPVPQTQLFTHEDGEDIEVSDLILCAIDTPGHANHHFAYILEDTCFSGDIAGVRLPGLPHLRLPMPPPEFHLEKWRNSLKKLSQVEFDQIATTHFGIYTDAKWHLSRAHRALDEVERWMEQVMPADLPVETLQEEFVRWARYTSQQDGLDDDLINSYETTNPSWMSAHGIYRYWKKVLNRQPEG